MVCFYRATIDVEFSARVDSQPCNQCAQNRGDNLSSLQIGQMPVDARYEIRMSALSRTGRSPWTRGVVTKSAEM